MSPPETAPVPTGTLTTELLVPIDVDDYDAHAYLNRQRAWSLILPDDLSQYRWDMRSQSALHCPRAEHPSNQDAPSEHDNHDDDYHILSTGSNPITAHPTNSEVDGHDADDDDGAQDPGDSMHIASFYNAPPQTCPFKFINKHAGSHNYMGCPFLRCLGHDPAKLLAVHNYPVAFKVFANSICHHRDALLTNLFYFDAIKSLDSITHPIDFLFEHPTGPGLDILGALPFTTWDYGETPDAFASTLFTTASGLPGRKPAPARSVRRTLLPREDYEDIHFPCYRSSWFLDPILVLGDFEADIASSLLATLLCPSEGDEFNKANGHAYPARERNLTVSEFIRQWYVRHKLCHPNNPRNRRNQNTQDDRDEHHLGFGEDFWSSITDEAAYIHDWVRPKKISRPANANCHEFDIQGIPWSTTLQTRRGHAREIRDNTYKSYRNISRHDDLRDIYVLPRCEQFYFPKTMYTEYKAGMEHFQLRNLLSATASNTVHYARDSKVYTVVPFYEDEQCIIDLSDPEGDRPFMDYVRITTLKAKHGVTIVGGFEGEYAYRGEITGHTVAEGYVNSNPCGIVTHVDIVKNRTSGTPNAIIATNDADLHILDCETGTFTDRQRFGNPINCTDTAPAGDLRVIVGDARSAWVIDAAGKPVRELAGHSDFGFACAWSPDSLHVATANQDRTVNIWDVRMWRPLIAIHCDVACYRSLRYSPLGCGPPTLLMCEPADRVVLVNAMDYRSRQVHDFFGEIGGADFTPDGHRIWVANMDPEFGGLIEYERNGRYIPFY